jgi:hypothetical protein
VPKKIYEYKTVKCGLDNVENTNVSEDKLTRIGPAPKFELINQMA